MCELSCVRERTQSQSIDIMISTILRALFDHKRVESIVNRDVRPFSKWAFLARLNERVTQSPPFLSLRLFQISFVRLVGRLPHYFCSEVGAAAIIFGPLSFARRTQETKRQCERVREGRRTDGPACAVGGLVLRPCGRSRSRSQHFAQ